MTNTHEFELEPDVTYTADIVWDGDPEPSGRCELEINGKRVSLESLRNQINTFEGWKLDLRVHE